MMPLLGPVVVTHHPLAFFPLFCSFAEAFQQRISKVWQKTNKIHNFNWGVVMTTDIGRKWSGWWRKLHIKYEISRLKVKFFANYCFVMFMLPFKELTLMNNQKFQVVRATDANCLPAIRSDSQKPLERWSGSWSEPTKWPLSVEKSLPALHAAPPSKLI